MENDVLKDDILDILGIDRKTILEQFTNQMGDEVIRRIASPELTKILLNNEVPDNLATVELVSLKNSYQSAICTLEKKCNTVKSNISNAHSREIAALNTEGLLDWLEKHGEYVDYYKLLSTFITQEVFSIEYKIMTYTQKKKVFYDLTNHYFSTNKVLFGYIGNLQNNSQKTCFLDALMYINETRIMIWQKNPKNNSKVLAVHSFGPDMWRNHIHILHNDTINQFQKLEIISKNKLSFDLMSKS